MENINKIIELDIKAAVQAFKANDFSTMNTFANRSMANAIMGENKKLLLPGFFLKDLALTYGIIFAQKDSAISTAKTVGNSYLESVLSITRKPDEKKLGALWKEFFDFNLKIKTYLKDDFERDNYMSDDPNFSHEAFVWLLNRLDESKNVLVNPRSLLLEGTINEMERIFKVHGCVERDFYTLSMMKALQRYFSYFKIAYRKEDRLDEEVVKTVFPHIEKMKKVLSNEKIEIEGIMDEVWNLTTKWRIFFIEYMEIKASISIEKAIQLPEEVKSRLTKSVTQAMEKEVKEKKETEEKQ